MSNIPVLPPMTQLMTPELLLSSLTPEKRPLADFCVWALHTPDFADAPVQQVSCNRLGVHEFVIIACKVTLSSNRSVHTVWLRLERHPSEGGIGLMSSKPNHANDTVQVGKNVDALIVAKRGQKCVSRGTFSYYPEDSPTTTLTLRHIAEMLLCFTKYSSSYSLLKTNCRWLCYALLECLRECHTCYGGNWIGPPPQRADNTTDIKTALEAKNLYLKEKHPRCCMKDNSRTSNESQSDLVGVPAADVIYSTPAPPAPSAQPVQPPVSTGNNAYTHPPSYSPHVYSSALPPNTHQFYTGNGTPRRENIPLPAPSASSFQPSGYIHPQNRVNTRVRAQAPPPDWRTSSYSSTHHCSPPSGTAALPRPNHPYQATQGSYDQGGMSDYRAHPSSHPRSNTSNSCDTCGSNVNSYHLGNTTSRGNFNPPAPRGHNRAPSAGSQYPSGDFYSHHTHMNHGHYHHPADLYSIPDGGSYMEHQSNWSPNYQPPPSNSEHGPCFGCSGHQTMHPRQPTMPAPGPSNSAPPQMPGYGPSYPQHYDDQPYPHVMGTVPPHQPPRPEPGRSWTQEMWMNPGSELQVPMRTESPGPLEQGSLDPQEQPIPLMRMPDPREYMSLT